MKSRKKLWTVLLLMMIMLLAVHSSLAEDIQITVQTDKESYAEGDVATVDVTIVNEGNSSLSNLAMQTQLPDELMVYSAEGADYTFDQLDPGDSVSYSFRIGLKKAMNMPKTGDGSMLGLWLVLMSGALVGVCLMRRSMRGNSGMMFALLCLSASLMYAAVPVITANAASVNSRTVTTPFSFGGRSLNIVSEFSWEEEETEESDAPQQTASIKGRIVDLEGKLSDAKVWVRIYREDETTLVKEQCVSGEYFIDGIQPGWYFFTLEGIDKFVDGSSWCGGPMHLSAGEINKREDSPATEFCFDFEDEEFKVNGYNADFADDKTECVIPAEIDGCPVTEVGGTMFRDNTSLRRVYIPKSVTKISSHAFGNNSSELVIYGEKGSYAETFAKENGITFSAM